MKKVSRAPCARGGGEKRKRGRKVSARDSLLKGKEGLCEPFGQVKKRVPKGERRRGGKTDLPR